MKEIIVAVIGLGAIVLFFYTIYYLLFRYGQSPRTLTPKQLMDRNMICPHCQMKGSVTTQPVTRKSGIHGGKATAALLTAGISLLGTGLLGGIGSMSISPEKLDNTHFRMIYRKRSLPSQEKTCQAVFCNILI